MSVDGHIEVIDIDTIYVSTGRSENGFLEFVYDIVYMDWLDGLYVIVYDDTEMAWHLQSLWGTDNIALTEISMNEYVKLGNLIEDEYWRKKFGELYECHEETEDRNCI